MLHQHCFDISIAQKFDVDTAIILNHLAFWIKKNQANNKHFHDGRYWTYSTLDAFTVLFPYWSRRQIERILRNCEKWGLIMKNNFNSNSYDRTMWYSLTDFGHELLNFPISPNSEMDRTERGKGITQTVTPIPDNKTDNINRFKERERLSNNVATYFPPNLRITPSVKEFCDLYRIDPEWEMQKFRDYCLSKGKTYKDYDAAFRNWLKKSIEYKEVHKNAQIRKGSAFENCMQTTLNQAKNNFFSR